MDYFEHAWRLLHLFWIIPLFGILSYYASSKRKTVLKTIFGGNADVAELTTLSTGKRLARQWLLLVAIIMLCVAAARPRWDWRILPFSTRGRDLMIVLDTSKSMLSEDISPSRLKHAKLFIRNLVEQTPGDRYGLVAFAGDAFLECPLTMDKTSFFQALDEISPDSVPLGGTNIQRALEKTLAAFKGAEGGYKAIILLTDGDELSGDSSKVVAQLKKRKIPIFVVGIGKPSGDGLIKMTGPDGKIVLLRDRSGKLVKSHLNEKGLRRLALATPGGVFVRSTGTNLGLVPLLKKVHGLVPKEYATGIAKRPIEKFHYPLLVAVICLLVRMGLGERRENQRAGKAAAAALSIAVLAVAGFDVSAATPISPAADGQPALNLASPIKTKTGEETKTDAPTPEQLYNKGLKFHREKDIDNAEKFYRAAINASKVAPEARSKAFQNLGVIAHQQGRSIMMKKPEAALKIFDKAESMYRESMRSDIKRKRVVLNQQKLLDDREIAKKIKKRMEELRKKQQQARQKTQQALNQQKKENKQKNKSQKQNQQNKNQKQQQQCDQQKQNNKQQQKNQRNKQEKRNQQGQNSKNQQQRQQQEQNQNQQKDDGQKKNQRQQQKQNGQRKNQNQQNKQNAKEQQRNQSGGGDKIKDKIKSAQKAVNDYEKEANSQKRKQEEANAAAAKQELDKAMKEHSRGNGEKAEEHLKKALNRLGGAENNKNQSKQNRSGGDKNKSQNQNKGQNDKRNKNDKKGRGEKMDDNRPIPKQPRGQEQPRDGESGKQKEKKIDPAQAAALLDLMANQEKTLRDAIKEYQNRNAKIKKVLKDW